MEHCIKDSDALYTAGNLAEAKRHIKNAEAIMRRSKATNPNPTDSPEGFQAQASSAMECHDEYTQGIELLAVGSSLGTDDVLDLMVVLRERRAAMTNLIAVALLQGADAGNARESPSQIEGRCREMFDDATCVIDMPSHADTDLIRTARVHRTQAVALLNNSLRIEGIDREKSIALRDCNAILQDVEATQMQKALAGRTAGFLSGMVTSTAKLNAIMSIRDAFLTFEELISCGDALSVNAPGQPRHCIARVYMDKPGPISMSDGSPKQLPPGVRSVDDIIHMSTAQLNRTFGHGSGGFHGECIFWKRNGGIFLGKHKWETESVKGNFDLAKLGELWDMRWLMATDEQAKKFHRSMLETSRAEGNNGYLDSFPEVTLTADEINGLHDSIDVDNLVFYGSNPKKKPSPNQPAFSSLMMNPTAFLQQYGAVFTVGRLVVKLYIIEGMFPQFGKLDRSSMVGKTGLVNAAAKACDDWLNGNRSGAGKYPSSYPPLASNSKPDICSNCGKKVESLSQCSRCKYVAYCNRDCQLSHYKEHKMICKGLASM